MFAAEIFMHRFLLSSPVRTLNPEEADWFYTPVYSTCDLTPNGLPLPFKSPRMMRSAIQLISSNWPYWNRTEGADHFFVVPHDFGACFHYQVRRLFELICVISSYRNSLALRYILTSVYPTGRKSDWKRDSSFATTCYFGSDIWSAESCLLEGRLHHYSTICSSAENASTSDPSRCSSLHICLLPWTFLWCWEWPRRRLLCKVCNFLYMFWRVPIAWSLWITYICMNFQLQRQIWHIIPKVLDKGANWPQSFQCYDLELAPKDLNVAIEPQKFTGLCNQIKCQILLH